MKEKFTQALPKGSDVEQAISSVIATVSTTEALQRCAPDSIAMAAYQAATVGLPVNALQLAYLVPYKGEVKFMPSYRGYVYLALQTGYVVDIYAETVHKGEVFKVQLGSRPDIQHEPNFDDRRGEVIAVYAIAKLSNGLNKQVVLSKEQIEKIRSCSQSANGTTWTKHYEEMAKKSAIKRLCKLLPMTGNFHNIQRAMQADDEVNQVVYQGQPTPIQLAQPGLTSPASLRQQQTQLTSADIPVDTAIEESEPATDEHERNKLCSEIRDLQAAIYEKDKKVRALPHLDDLTIGDLEELLKAKQQHYELCK